MGLDIENVGIGVLLGWGSAYLVYRSRHGIKRVIGVARGGAASAQTAASQSADRRYINDLVARVDASGMLGSRIPLSSQLVEPRFVPLRPVETRLSGDQSGDLYAGIPLTHDLPYLYAPFNLETVRLEDLATGSSALALLGLPGSGRTTALLAAVLLSLGRLHFPPSPDKVQARLDQEEAELSEKERAVRVKERLLTEQRAKERLASERADLAPHEIEPAKADSTAPLRFNQRVPIYVHLAELLAEASQFTNGTDPAEPLVRAVQASVGRVTSSTIPRELYKWLNRGLGLALIDGYDELGEVDQLKARAWLKAFRTVYPDTFLIVSGGVEGSGPLLDLGLTPVYLRPWNDLDVAALAAKLAAAPPADRKAKATPPPNDAARERAIANSRALSAAEVTLKIAANFGGKVEATGVEGWLRSAITPLLPSDQKPADLYPRLAQLAALQLDEGLITPERMAALSIQGQAAAEGDRADADTPAPKANAAKQTSDQARLLHTLERSELLLERGGERYQFRHPLYAAYLGSLYLKSIEMQARLKRLDRPSWKQAFAFLALHTSVDDLVRQRMANSVDVLHAGALDVARWMAYAPSDAPWRGPVLRTIGGWFGAAAQYPLLRERAAAALVGTRDPSVLVIFRQGARNANPTIRRLACLGMGALGLSEAVRDLGSLIQDREAPVSLAAALALGGIRSDDALQELLVALTQGSEAIRQVTAEALATMPNDGYEVLYEAVQDDDMLLRRAAIFGLRRIRTPWATIAIYRAFLEDEQWYVRSAAQQAFEEIQYGRPSSLTPPPVAPGDMDWLALWAAHRGENVPAGAAGYQVLVRVLQEGDSQERALAALNLGSLGVTSSLRPLYAALRDRQDGVRAAAYRALGDLQSRTALAIPLPA
ncbi:MAG: HEAT repeat domain-containing protein [Anaerolineae bacterium]